MRKEFKCCVCGKTKPYKPTEYAGATDELAKETQTSGDICKPCREDYNEFDKRQSQEFKEWLESKKVKTGG